MLGQRYSPRFRVAVRLGVYHPLTTQGNAVLQVSSNPLRYALVSRPDLLASTAVLIRVINDVFRLALGLEDPRHLPPPFAQARPSHAGSAVPQAGPGHSLTAHPYRS